jgi:hypothetical protein
VVVEGELVLAVGLLMIRGGNFGEGDGGTQIGFSFDLHSQPLGHS